MFTFQVDVVVINDDDKKFSEEEQEEIMLQIAAKLKRITTNEDQGSDIAVVTQNHGTFRIGFISYKLHVHKDGIKYTKENFGIFGGGESLRDEQGFIHGVALIQESGLFAGTPPPEFRISSIHGLDEEKCIKEVAEDLNKKGDLPYYVKKCMVKIL